MNSETVFAGTKGCTTMTLGPCAKPATGASSLRKSKVSVRLLTVALMALADVTAASV